MSELRAALADLCVGGIARVGHHLGDLRKGGRSPRLRKARLGSACSARFAALRRAVALPACLPVPAARAVAKCTQRAEHAEQTLKTSRPADHCLR